MEYTFKSANEAFCVIYDDIAHELEQHDITDFYQSQPRGRKCNETIGCSIKILEPQNCLVWTKVRKLSPIYLAKECLWYLNGSRKVEDAPSKVWAGLVNKDGDEIGLINSNYGHYIFTQRDNKNPKLSVFEATVELLKKDKDSRQAIWQIPIMKHRQDDDTPCTSSLHFLIRDNKLYCTTYMRSCDIWFGFANDISQFIIWQMMLAKELNVELGWYRHMFGSFHVYEENFIKDNEQYIKDMNETYLQGKENISYPKFYDDRNYREILNEIQHDFKILSSKTRDEILNNNLLKNYELKYMLKNMQVAKFIH